MISAAGAWLSASAARRVAAIAIGTRLLAWIAGWLGTYFGRGDYRFWSGLEGTHHWAFTPNRFFDVFGRWDTWHYMRIAAAGYHHSARPGE